MQKCWCTFNEPAIPRSGRVVFLLTAVCPSVQQHFSFVCFTDKIVKSSWHLVTSFQVSMSMNVFSYPSLINFILNPCVILYIYNALVWYFVKLFSLKARLTASKIWVSSFLWLFYPVFGSSLFFILRYNEYRIS